MAHVNLTRYERLLRHERTLEAVGRKVRNLRGGNGVSRQRVFQIGQKYFPDLMPRFTIQLKRQRWEIRKRQMPKDYATALVARRAKEHGLSWEQVRVKGETGFRRRKLLIKGERHFIVYIRQVPKRQGGLSYVYRSYLYSFLRQFEKMVLVIRGKRKHRYFRFPVEAMLESCEKRGLARVYIVLPLHPRLRSLHKGVSNILPYEDNWR